MSSARVPPPVVGARVPDRQTPEIRPSHIKPSSASGPALSEFLIEGFDSLKLNNAASSASE